MKEDGGEGTTKTDNYVFGSHKSGGFEHKTIGRGDQGQERERRVK